MTIVEHTYPPFRWGDDLQMMTDDDRLLVGGRSAWMRSHRPSSDLLREYMKAPKNWSNRKHTGKDAPHVRFANADTDEKLIAFVKEFGPVVVSALIEDNEHSTMVGTQDLRELREERVLYKSALVLISLLARDRKPENREPLSYISTIVERLREWPRQWERERKMRGKEGTQTEWRFSQQDLEYVESCAENASWMPRGDKRDVAAIFKLSGLPGLESHNIMCTLISTFRIRVYRWGERTIEGPDTDLRFGIRPLLYYLLRRTYLGRDLLAICRNEQCRQMFEVERAGQRFCDSECSRRQRQREYWASTGKKQRRQRTRRKQALAKKVSTMVASGSSRSKTASK
jgi:hypothetical protein